MTTASQPMKKDAAEITDNSAPPATAAKGAGTGPEGAGNVDKIRDILFGAQMRDYEQKFTSVEESLSRETAELREEIRNRLASIEARVNDGSAAVADQLQAEQGERIAGDKELAREAKENTKAWEKRASQIEEQTAKALRDLRQHVSEESRRLAEAVEQRHRELAAALEKERQDLRAALTDRMALAELFAEMSLRLKNASAVPAKR